jgi:hypothetical protein
VSFQVEDGSGLASANSYGAYAGMVAYFADRGVTFAQAQGIVETALIRATDFLDQRYCFKGCKLAPAVQALQWPRYGVYDEEGILLPPSPLPVALVKATYELAQRALAADLSPDPTFDASGVAVVASTDKIGPIEVTRQFSGASPSSSFAPVYPEVDQLLRRLVLARVRVYRA